MCFVGAVTLEGLTASKKNEGNVHLYGQPVCDDDWDRRDGEVVCQELGFSGLVRVTVGSAFGEVSADFAMDDVQCNGTEASLEECEFTKVHNCGPGEGAGVVCTSSTSSNATAGKGSTRSIDN